MMITFMSAKTFYYTASYLFFMDYNEGDSFIKKMVSTTKQKVLLTLPRLNFIVLAK